MQKKVNSHTTLDYIFSFSIIPPPSNLYKNWNKYAHWHKLQLQTNSQLKHSSHEIVLKIKFAFLTSSFKLQQLPL